MSGASAISENVTCVWCGKSGHKRRQCKEKVTAGGKPGLQVHKETQAIGSFNGRGVRSSALKGTNDVVSGVSMSQAPQARNLERNYVLEATLMLAMERLYDPFEWPRDIFRVEPHEYIGMKEELTSSLSQPPGGQKIPKAPFWRCNPTSTP